MKEEKRKKEREKERERETDRQTVRQTDKEIFVRESMKEEKRKKEREKEGERLWKRTGTMNLSFNFIILLTLIRRVYIRYVHLQPSEAI